MLEEHKKALFLISENQVEISQVNQQQMKIGKILLLN